MSRRRLALAARGEAVLATRGLRDVKRRSALPRTLRRRHLGRCFLSFLSELHVGDHELRRRSELLDVRRRDGLELRRSGRGHLHRSLALVGKLTGSLDGNGCEIVRACSSGLHHLLNRHAGGQGSRHWDLLLGDLRGEKTLRIRGGALLRRGPRIRGDWRAGVDSRVVGARRQTLRARLPRSWLVADRQTRNGSRRRSVRCRIGKRHGGRFRDLQNTA